MSEIQPSSSANVHGVFVGGLSPIKPSRKNSEVKYFEGQLSDGRKTVRVVSFDPKLRGEIEEARQQRYGVGLMNCCIKRSRNPERNKFEVIVGNKTTVVKSPKKFKIDTETEAASLYCCPELTTLELVKDVAKQLTVTGKVVSVSDTEQVTMKNSNKSLSKMDFTIVFTIADCTAVYRGVVWENQIKTIKE